MRLEVAQCRQNHLDNDGLFLRHFLVICIYMTTQSDLASVSGTYTELVFFNFVTKLHVIGQPRSQRERPGNEATSR